MDCWFSFSPRSRCAAALLRHMATLALLLLVGVTHADEMPPDCGDLGNQYGPYDYTNPTHFREKLPIVEQYHFSREQELSTFKPHSKQGVDFDYTLRAFPNHHRALMALVRWLKNHSVDAWPGKMRPECYFHRSLAWRPRDSVARMIFGLYLHQNQRLQEAEFQYQTAVKVQPDYAEAHYNLGLLYAEQKRWPNALAEAHKAYALNYPLPGLKKRLTDAKQWKEPAPVSASPVPPTPADDPQAKQPDAAPEKAAEGQSDSPTTPTPTSATPTPGTSR
jgi:tetratricopeptide (TPR) repeat protein